MLPPVVLPRWPCCDAYSLFGLYWDFVTRPPLAWISSHSSHGPFAHHTPPAYSPPSSHSQGIHWQEADKLVAVSDKMKSGGKQPFMCMTHDQSIHTFLIPA